MLLGFSLLSQEVTDNYYQKGGLKYEDHIYKPGIRTVRFHPIGNNLGMPILKLRSGEQLILSFDDLYDDFMNLSYSVVHCNSDWTPSNLMTQEYLTEVFQDFYFQDYQYSVNALIQYTNYQLTLPNNDVNFTKSGNYLLLVYANDDKNDLVLTRRFMIYEDAVSVSGEVKRATQVDLQKTHQEVDFIINHTGYNIQNPFRDLTVHILQNQRWDNAITTLKPQFVQNQQLVYQHDRENTFPGLNEFRFFDTKNLFSLTQNVRKIDRDSVFTVYLAEDEPRPITRYSVYFDVNGHYVVRRLDTDFPDYEADYAYVDFILNEPTPLETGDVYLFGKFTDWKLLPEYKLKYDYVRNAYRLKVLMKQGYYNYMFAILEDGKREVDVTKFEGSHWETENTYQIFIYNKEIGQRYERLIGFGELSSEDLFN